MTLEHNRSAIERHIDLLTQPWIEDGLSARLELRCLQVGGRSKSLYVDPSRRMTYSMMRSLKSVISIRPGGTPTSV